MPRIRLGFINWICHVLFSKDKKRNNYKFLANGGCKNTLSKGPGPEDPAFVVRLNSRVTFLCPYQ
jgi:hypothetical protein